MPISEMRCYLIFIHIRDFQNTAVPVISSAMTSGSGAFQMTTCPSLLSSAAVASTLNGGKGQSQKRFSNFFYLFWHEASLG